MLLITVLVIAVAGGFAADRESSTPEERSTFVTAAKELEANPLAAGARGTRQALLEWIINVPDVEVKTCVDILSPIRDDDYPYAGEISLHEVFAAGIFAIEYPDKAKDDVAMYTAGLEGALRVYEVILEADSSARLDFMDALLTKRDSGKLTRYVAKIAKKNCK